MIYTKYGILASAVPITAPGISNALIYTCPAGRRARIRVLGHFITGGGNGLACLIHSIAAAPSQRERQRLPFVGNIGSTHVFTVDAVITPFESSSIPDGRTINTTVALAPMVFELNPGDRIEYSQDAVFPPTSGKALLMGYEYIPEIS